MGKGEAYPAGETTMNPFGTEAIWWREHNRLPTDGNHNFMNG